MEILESEEKFKDKQEIINRLIDIKQNFEKSGWTKGEFEVSIIPALPYKNFSDFQKDIFLGISKHNNKCLMQDLIKELKTEEIKERSFRSKLSYALRDLLDYGLVKKKQEGRQKYLILTEIGQIFNQYLT